MVEFLLVGVYHIDVNVAGHSRACVVKFKTLDSTRLSDFIRRVNLLSQAIISNITDWKNRAGKISMTNPYKGGVKSFKGFET